MEQRTKAIVQIVLLRSARWMDFFSSGCGDGWFDGLGKEGLPQVIATAVFRSGPVEIV